MSNTIPSYMLRDKRWAALIHLFQNNDKLNTIFTTKYFLLEEGRVKVQSLKRATQGWSQSEKFMMNLALHCFNERNKVDLGDMDYLDVNNTELAFEALKIRYSY